MERTALILATVTLAGCDVFGPDPVEPITQLPRALTVAEQSVIRNGNAFGFELVHEVARSDDRPNIVLSPFSASMALGMTLNGADGTTFEAMSTTLGFADLSREEINASYAGLIELLTTLDPAVTFEIANSVWANQEFPFHQAFLDVVAEAFAARVESRDFEDPATLAAVNAWVEESTAGLIDTILESLDPDLVMLLINAIYFEGAWTTEFDPGETRPAPFQRADGSSVQVDMMTQRNVEVSAAGGPGWSAVELPYGGEAFSMVVVLPDDELLAFAETLDADRWDEIVSALAPRELDVVSIPKHTLTFDANLNESLRGMGMDVAFRPAADFTRMSPIGDQLCIDFVRQKTFLEVDERGTRAAAATAVGVRPTSLGTAFIADRPYLLAIRERLSGTVLFVGLVSDPTAEDPGPEPFEKTCR